jgi:hypothetical protein
MAALSLRSFDRHRQYPADLAGYYSRCPSGKSKTNRFISAFFLVKFTSKPTWSPNVHYRADTRAWVLFSRHTELAEYGCKVFHQVVDIFFSSPVKALKIDFFVFVHKQISESDRLDHSIGEIGGQKAIFL